MRRKIKRKLRRNPVIWIVMGPAGSGKSTIVKMIARALHRKRVDADSCHSEAAKRQMSQGIPLTDKQRRPWLKRVACHIKRYHDHNGRLVLACSALRAVHREQLTEGISGVRFVCITGSFEVLRTRLKERPDHFFQYNRKLVKAQLAALEEPNGCGVLKFRIKPSLDRSDDKTFVSRLIAAEVLRKLRKS